MAVQVPLAAGSEQAVNDEGFENFEPRGSFAGGAEAGLPEVVQPEVIPEFEGEPASAPLAGAGEFDLAESELDGGVFEGGIGGAVFGEEVDLAGLVGFVEGFDGASPAGTFAVVDLAKIEQGLLDGFASGDATVFHHPPVAMLFAVLESSVVSQQH